MKARITALFAFALLVVAVAIPVSGAGGKLPPTAPEEFFGIAPQTALTERDIEYMKGGGIGSIRVPISWGIIQPTPKRTYNWETVDELLELTAPAGLKVLPFVYGTPHWLGAATKLPVDSARARSNWSAFLKALVGRYGPGGEFWKLRATETGYDPAIRPAVPVTEWQIWNEANFFYFALPATPTRYAKLLKLSSQAIKSVRPGAKIVLSGLFGEPKARPPKGMDATKFLEALYRVPGLKHYFDGVALHPYAVDAETLEEFVEAFHEVSLENRDRPGLYITEVGWGSQNNFQQVAFEQGIRGQVRQLKDSYTYLLENRRRLNLKQVYWYSWKDTTEYGACNFCDSVGLLKSGDGFKPKPAWHAFVALSGGSARP